MSRHTASRSRRTRGLLASFAAVALGFTGLVVLATGASAHSATLSGQASCADRDGNFTISWTLSGDTSGKTMRAWTNWGDPFAGLDIVGGGSSYSGAAGNVFTGSYAGDSTQYATTSHDLDAVPGSSVIAEGKVIWTKPGRQPVVVSVQAEVWLPKGCSVPVTPPIHTEATCGAPGTLVGVDTDDYYWESNGDPTAATLTAKPKGYVVLDPDPAVFPLTGPVDLTQLTGDEACPPPIDEGPDEPTDPPAEEDPPTEEAPPTVTQTSLAETGFPLLGVLGLAGAFSLIGGGLVNARRLLRKSD